MIGIETAAAKVSILMEDGTHQVWVFSNEEHRDCFLLLAIPSSSFRSQSGSIDEAVLCVKEKLFTTYAVLGLAVAQRL
ncbi:hypothetical protein ES705_12773 [subsurface metagenome]